MKKKIIKSSILAILLIVIIVSTVMNGTWIVYTKLDKKDKDMLE